MLQRLVTRVRNYWTPPIVGDAMAFAKLAGAHQTTLSRLGSMGEARKMLRDAKDATRNAIMSPRDLMGLRHDLDNMSQMLNFHDQRHTLPRQACECQRGWTPGYAEGFVGRIADVSRLFGHRHLAGMEVRRGENGWTLEHLVFRDEDLQVIRHYGRLMGCSRGIIQRTEMGRGINYI